MTYIPNVLYSAKLYDHSGNLITVLSQWDRMEFSLRVSDADNHSIQVRLQKDDPTCELFRTLKRDSFFIVEKIDQFTGARYTVYEGLHQTSSEQTQLSGDIFFTLYGVGPTRLLKRRLCVPNANQESDNRSGAGESIIKQYVYVNCVNPTDALRKFPGLSIAGDLGRGATTEYSARYTNLDSVISAIAEDSDLDYKVVRKDGLGTFEFDARPLWGKDRSLDNTDGNDPVVFDLGLNNILIPIFSINHRNEVNFVYAAGKGRAENRIVLEVAGDSDALIESPWSRSELFVNASQEDTEVALFNLAKRTLDDRGKTETFDFDVVQTVNTRWPVHWNIGDIVSARYYGDRLFKKKINEITVTLSSTAQREETIRLDMEDI